MTDRPVRDVPPPDWRTIAHPAQLPPDLAPNGAPWSTWLFQGGRGAGKTRAGAEWLAAQAALGGRYALVGATLNDVREVMIEGPSGLKSLERPDPPVFEPSRRRLLWPASGAEAYAFSAEEPERLRGPQFHAAWGDEFCAWPRADYALALLRMGLRLGEHPRLVLTTTPKPTRVLRDLRAEISCAVTEAGTAANAAHLAPAFVESLHALYGDTTLFKQEIEGLIVDGGALITRADVEAARGAIAPARFERVIVAVDPPAGVGGAACGIVVAGREGDTGYVLADRTQHGLNPLGWAHLVARAAEEFVADEIVAESNQGGEMVRTTLILAGATTPIRLVNARLAKVARAEPIALLYAQRRVRHCAPMRRLEEELLALASGALDGRLDRADALVWALHTLMVEPAPTPRVLGA